MTNHPSNSEVQEGDIVEIAGTNGPIRMKVVLLDEDGPAPGEPGYHGLYLEQVSGSRTMRILLSAAKILRVIERATPSPQSSTDSPETYPTGDNQLTDQSAREKIVISNYLYKWAGHWARTGTGHIEHLAKDEEAKSELLALLDQISAERTIRARIDEVDVWHARLMDIDCEPDQLMDVAASMRVRKKYLTALRQPTEENGLNGPVN